MTKDSNYLIVYGTLRPPFINPFAQFLRQHGRYVGEATFPGLLFSVEWFDTSTYPGAIYQPDGDTRVDGIIYDIGIHKRAVFAYLDDYEGVGEAFDRPNEYVRVVIPVRYRDAIIACWVYLYNRPIDGKPLIASGDYVRYSRNE